MYAYVWLSRSYVTCAAGPFQAAWLQLTDTSSAGVVAAELAFLGAQLAEVPALEQLDAMQGSRAGSHAPDQLGAAQAPQHCPAEASSAAAGASVPGSRPEKDRGSACQTMMQSVSGAGIKLDAHNKHAVQPGALGEGFTVSGSLRGAPAPAHPAASQSQGAWQADGSCAVGGNESDGAIHMAVPPRT